MMRAGDRAANVLTHRVSETIRFDANCCDLPPISRVGGNDNRRFAPLRRRHTVERLVEAQAV